MEGRLFIIAGCSGAGKDTLIDYFLKNSPHKSNIIRSVSAATRAPREGEINGKDYFFISKEEFIKSIENNEFLEWTEFCGNYYGTKKSIIEKALAEGKDIILKIEVKGAAQVKAKIKSAKTIFIMPPDMKVLEERLRKRNTDSETAVRERLKEAEREIEAGKLFDYIIVNDKIDSAAAKLQAVFENQ